MMLIELDRFTLGRRFTVGRTTSNVRKETSLGARVYREPD
jgi:hypothetical protein